MDRQPPNAVDVETGELYEVLEPVAVVAVSRPPVLAGARTYQGNLRVVVLSKLARISDLVGWSERPSS